MLEETCRANLMRLAELYAMKTGVELTTLSTKFYGNMQFFQRFGAGEISVSLRKYDEMVGQFSTLWPDGVPWPRLRAPEMKRPPRGEVKRRKEGGKRPKKILVEAAKA